MTPDSNLPPRLIADLTRERDEARALANETQEWLADALDALGVGTVFEIRAARAYDREVLVNVLVYHYRKDIGSCGCGWSELGRSHVEHVADVYEQSVAVRAGVAE